MVTSRCISQLHFMVPLPRVGVWIAWRMLLRSICHINIRYVHMLRWVVFYKCLISGNKAFLFIQVHVQLFIRKHKYLPYGSFLHTTKEQVIGIVFRGQLGSILHHVAGFVDRVFVLIELAYFSRDVPAPALECSFYIIEIHMVCKACFGKKR